MHSIRTKILLAISVFFAILLGVSGFFLLTQQQLLTMQESVDASQAARLSATDIGKKHYSWLNNLTEKVYEDAEFTGSLDHTSCSLGQWLAQPEQKDTTDAAYRALLDKLVAPHETIHQEARRILTLLDAGDAAAAQAVLTDVVRPNTGITIATLEDIAAHQSQVSAGYVAAYQQTTDRVWISSIAMLGASLALFVLAFLWLSKQIVPPIRRLTEAAEAVANGETELDLTMRRRDEIGSLAESFQRMIAGIAEQAQTLADVADGDLTTSIASRSERDILNIKLQQMIEQNARVIGSIRDTIGEVRSGADSISSSSQQLAVGAGEQAAAVEEIHATVDHVTELARHSANETQRLTEMTGGVSDVAERGATQMRELVQAVEDIQRASDDISKIIKVIDDIAFQTNILALNASVEAARAGAHGKGFAVVADEVRNLAAKSAQAANETTQLIQRSIQMASDGVRIANATETTLQGIVESVDASSSEITIINEDITSLMSAFEQIAQGIASVSSVVQQNNAASQESAAASITLSQMAKELSDLAGVYRIAR